MAQAYGAMAHMHESSEWMHEWVMAQSQYMQLLQSVPWHICMSHQNAIWLCHGTYAPWLNTKDYVRSRTKESRQYVSGRSLDIYDVKTPSHIATAKYDGQDSVTHCQNVTVKTPSLIVSRLRHILPAICDGVLTSESVTYCLYVKTPCLYVKTPCPSHITSMSRLHDPHNASMSRLHDTHIASMPTPWQSLDIGVRHILPWLYVKTPCQSLDIYEWVTARTNLTLFFAMGWLRLVGSWKL